MSDTPTTIAELLERAAQHHGDRIAIEDGECLLSFLALREAAHRVARACIVTGLKPGERAAIWAPNLWQWIVAALGIQLAGGVLVPINTRFKGAEAGWILRRSGARLLFTVTDFLDIDYLAMLRDQELPELRERILLCGVAPDTTGWEEFCAAGDADTAATTELEHRCARASGEDLLDLMFTSGTTGKPKGVLSVHAQNLRVYDVWSRTVGLNAQDNYLIISPFFHAFGYKAGWLASLLRGCRILPMVHFDQDEVLRRIAAQRVSMLPGPPTIYQSLLAHPRRTEADLSSLRLAVTGAASVPEALVRRIRDELGFDSVVTAYGLTESCGCVTICDANDDSETIATTSGKAMPGIELRCVDADGRDVPVGEQGELLVRGFNVMHSYFEDAEATAAAIDADGWLATGDVAVLDQRGYIRITDRLKDMFICGGFNCYPAEIENTLSERHDIAQVAVIGVPDERLGEVAQAWVVPMPGVTIDERELINWCRERMANYKVPRTVRLCEALPLNAVGKVRKPQLREWASAVVEESS